MKEKDKEKKENTDKEKETSKDSSKETAKETSKDNSKDAGKEASKDAAKELSKDAGKTGEKDKAGDTQKEASDYDFIREQIRERPVNRKKLLRRFILTAGMALVFGLVACLTFLFLEPKLSKWLSGDEEMELKVVELPEQTEEEVLYNEQVLPEDEDPEQLVIETPINEMSLNDEDVVVSSNQAEESTSQNEAAEPTPESQKEEAKPQVVYEQVSLELEDYRQLYRKMYALSKEVSKSLVTVTAVPETTEWINSSDASDYQTVGLIVGENGYEMLILADTEKLEGAEDINVRFADGSRGKLSEKAVDSNTGLGIYGIRLAEMDPSTRENVTAAILGSSYASSILGNAVMAVGNPLGVSSICYGAVTSASRLVTMCDASYQLLTTDIYGSEDASGVIVNIRGQVTGIICQKHNDPGMENMIYAYGISSIRKLIEDLSNGKDRAGLGLHVGDISAEIAEDLNIPQGVYIEQVEMDSPALSAGLAKGDIITKIGEVFVNNVNDYMNALQIVEPGTDVKVFHSRPTGEEYKNMDIDITLGRQE